MNNIKVLLQYQGMHMFSKVLLHRNDFGLFIIQKKKRKKKRKRFKFSVMKRKHIVYCKNFFFILSLRNSRCTLSLAPQFLTGWMQVKILSIIGLN